MNTPKSGENKQAENHDIRKKPYTACPPAVAGAFGPPTRSDW